jgi:hypothetical protein
LQAAAPAGGNAAVAQSNLLTIIVRVFIK